MAITNIRFFHETTITRSTNTSHYPKEVPWELPEGWLWSTLGEVCSKVVDGDHNPPPSEPTPTEYLMISSKNVLDSHLDELKEVRYLSRSVFEECNKRTRLMRGDLLLTTVGTLGRSCIYDGNRKIVLQRSVSVLTPLVSSEYIKCFLDSGHFQRHIDNNARGTAQKGFYLNLLEATILPIPPLNEQRRIVAKTSSLLSELNRIDNENHVLQDRISQAKSRILDLAIHGKLVPQDPSEEPAIELLRRINPDFKPSHNLHYGDCPEGWTIATVADVFEINPKVQGFDEVDAGFVPMTNICDGFRNKFNFEVRKWGKIKNGFTRFANGDIAVAKISPCLENRKSAIMRNLPNGIGAGTTELNIFRSRAVNPEYGLLFFKSDDFINACVGSYNGVVGQQRVSRSLIEGMQFLLPPMDEQKRIVAVINGYFAVINEIESSLQ